MTPSREEKALSNLLRLAKLRADAVSARLAAASEAREAADNSIAWIDKAVAAEERAGAASSEAFLQFQRYLEGAELKRRTLAETRDRLAREIDRLREALAEAAVETRKFEHLLAVRAEAEGRRRARLENLSADEAALLRKT